VVAKVFFVFPRYGFREFEDVYVSHVYHIYNIYI
jgi:hypothetical protein